MAVEFQEYKGRGKRKPINPQHKFPLLRLLILAVAAFAVYWSGLITKIANELPLPGNESEPVVDTWETRCSFAGGSPMMISDNLVECSWEFTEERLDSLVFPNPFLRYLGSIREGLGSKMYWYASIKNFSMPIFVLFENTERYNYYHMMKADSSYVWIRKRAGNLMSDVAPEPAADNGCRFPGLCPHMPLEWSAVRIAEGFDFEGQESLIAADVFRGLGEAPVHAVLPGKVLNLGKDSLGYFVEIEHGNNILSKTSGLGSRNEDLAVGDSVRTDVPIGKLLPKDSSAFYLSIRENGRFVRWKDFYAEAYPFSAVEIEAYEASIRKMFY